MSDDGGSTSAEGPAETPPPTPLVEDWTDPAWITAQTQRLLAALAKDPTALGAFDRLLSEAKKTTPDANTATSLLVAVTAYFGSELATFLLDYLGRAPDSPDVTAVVDPLVPPDVSASLRLLVAQFGPFVKEAVVVGGEEGGSWRSINRQVYFDYVSNRWIATFEIVRYDGERILLTEDSESLLSLADAAIDTLNHLPAEFVPGLIGASRLDSFRVSVERFFASASPVEATPAGPVAPAEPVAAEPGAAAEPVAAQPAAAEPAAAEVAPAAGGVGA